MKKTESISYVVRPGKKFCIKDISWLINGNDSENIELRIFKSVNKNHCKYFSFKMTYYICVIHYTLL